MRGAVRETFLFASCLKYAKLPERLKDYGGAKMSESDYAALSNALASARMEGLPVTDQTEKDCVRLMTGDISAADLVKEILSRTPKAV